MTTQIHIGQVWKTKLQQNNENNSALVFIIFYALGVFFHALGNLRLQLYLYEL